MANVAEGITLPLYLNSPFSISGRGTAFVWRFRVASLDKSKTPDPFPSLLFPLTHAGFGGYHVSGPALPSDSVNIKTPTPLRTLTRTRIAMKARTPPPHQVQSRLSLGDAGTYEVRVRPKRAPESMTLRSPPGRPLGHLDLAPQKEAANAHSKRLRRTRRERPSRRRTRGTRPGYRSSRIPWASPHLNFGCFHVPSVVRQTDGSLSWVARVACPPVFPHSWASQQWHPTGKHGHS